MTNRGRFSQILNKTHVVLALSLVTFSYVIKYGTVQIITYIVRDQLEFAEDTYHFRTWRTNEHPYEVEFYFFNWTNSENVRDPSVKPTFDEVGPYKFHLFINRTNIKIHAHNSSVSYSFTKRFVPAPAADDSSAVGSLDDLVITLNPIANALAYQARHWSVFAKLAANFALRATKTDLHVRKTVRELLFEGYDDPLLDFVQKVPDFALKGFGIELKDKFGYFYKRNYTDLYFGPYNVHADPRKSSYGDIHTIKGLGTTPYFPDNCGRVEGKLGEYADLDHAHDKPMIVYVHDLNVITENYYLEERVFNNVLGSVYSPRDFIFDNGTFNESNKCFCYGECVPMGMLNSSATFAHAPIFMSLPHFLLADESYQNGVVVKYTDKGHFLPYIAVEQTTGLLLEGALNIQLNMLLQPVKGLGMFSDVPRVFMPIFSMKQRVVTRGGYLDLLVILQKIPTVINCLSFMLLFSGIAVLFFGKMIIHDNVYREYRQAQTK